MADLSPRLTPGHSCHSLAWVSSCGLSITCLPSGCSAPVPAVPAEFRVCRFSGSLGFLPPVPCVGFSRWFVLGEYLLSGTQEALANKT